MKHRAAVSASLHQRLVWIFGSRLFDRLTFVQTGELNLATRIYMSIGGIHVLEYTDLLGAILRRLSGRNWETHHKESLGHGFFPSSLDTDLRVDDTYKVRPMGCSEQDGVGHDGQG